jgi:transcriptional regulator with XRE-family HTH domain
MQVNSLNNFRTNVSRIMSERGLSYRDAAELAGMGYPFLHRIMTGKANPSIEVADKLADALGVKLTDLLEDPQKLAVSA